MALNNDSPPFAALQGSADEFKAAFDADIGHCLTQLNSKITALMCDPSSLGASGETRPGRGNAHVEFSMAKYEILADMKSLYDGKESEWMSRLKEMKEEFIENLEVFLANTKLEVKLPTATAASPRVGIRKMPASPNVAKQDAPSAIASIYPKLFNTAKHIPVLSSMLPTNTAVEEEEESSGEDEQPQVAQRPTGRTHKRVTISEPPYISSPGQNGSSRRRGIQAAANIVPMQVVNVAEESESEEEEEEPVVVQTPVKRVGRGRKSVANTPTSVKKEPVRTPLQRRNAPKKESESDSSNEEIAAPPVIETGRRGRKSVVAQPAVETVVNSTPGKRGRPKKKANGKEVQYQPDEEVMETDDDVSAAPGPQTPKQVHFSLGLDPEEDLEIYSPEYSLSRSVPRRKTMITHAAANFEDICLTPEVTRGKSKRKTFAGSHLDQSVAPSPKRLKRAGGRSSLAPSALGLDETMETNLLESEGASGSRYSPWIPLSDIAGSVPGQPGVYELKVSAAKKPAYIGACDSLRQKLTLHKLAQGSGHKQLDKFVERNGANILVRYEQMPTAQDAKFEEKNRVQDFVACYNTTPAYN